MASHQHQVEYFIIPLACKPEIIRDKINLYKPDRVIAVGGDGTVKLVAESLLDLNIPLGIIAAGSANGMAKELNLPFTISNALDVIIAGYTKHISLIRINNELCIHLSDIGFNAFVVKKFEAGKRRGMWGYIKAAWQVLRMNRKMSVRILADEKPIIRSAAMIVIANATRYGSGAIINPIGSLDDNVFEVIIVKEVSMKELFKMLVTHSNYDPQKTELLQASALQIQSKHKVHFQVDGEYLGKTNSIEATILPQALPVLVPGN